MSSEGTAYSPGSSPNKRDWAKMSSSNGGQYGSGPGLQDPDDPIQNSDTAFEHHMEKQANTVGPGPGSGTRRPSTGPRYEHFEHREHAQSPRLEAEPDHRLSNIPTAKTTSSRWLSNKTQQELEHRSTLTSFRTKIGLAPEPPILEEHDVHEHLTWSSIRTIFREPFAEFFGVFIMILFGDGSVAQVLLSTGQTSAPGGNGFGPYQSISWG